MKIEAVKTTYEEIHRFRNLHLQEINAQARYYARFERNMADSYLLRVDGRSIGYGGVMGQELRDRDTIFEIYVIPSYRKYTSTLFSALISASGANYIECQSNDLILSSLLFEFSENIKSSVILFDDHLTTGLNFPGIIFRKKKDDDIIFKHNFEPVGEYVLELRGEVVASGGFMLYYNMPFADLYMEVKQEHQRKGAGSYIIQELKKECYLSGRVPAARTGLENYASRATLIKAGMKVCGYMLLGEIHSNNKFT